MIKFFKSASNTVIAVETRNIFTPDEINKLVWLFRDASPLGDEERPTGWYVGARKEMITPWSTNAVEITQNMGLTGISRIEEYMPVASANASYDYMLQSLYDGLGQDLFTVSKMPDPVILVDDIEEYNRREGLALSKEEEAYLSGLAQRIGRRLTDSEVYGFAQVNSEHCRHKIFNGKFIIDGVEKEYTLFELIKKTSKENPNSLISAYKDNVAFNKGPVIEQFAPVNGDKPDFFTIRNISTALSLKAETHNFPTTVEPFNGAATGTGGEIRDRLGGGKASLPLAGTAVYMTSYPRTGEGREWEKAFSPRKWLYQTPLQILIKASNGASDFCNKYGQPLICGSLLTFEHEENGKIYGYDKVIMLAGGIGYANERDALKGCPKQGEKVIVMGGDNYRIGMGGGAVSSVNTGQYAGSIELNAVQRANPEMQKRVANVIRAIAESDDNPIISIHDHGAGGHLNCLSELLESTGGHINMNNLPIGDPTLSYKEIIGNESQERMGFLVENKDIDRIRRIAERERAPMYVVGETTDDMRLVFDVNGEKPIDLNLEDMFGNTPGIIMNDISPSEGFYKPFVDDETKIHDYLKAVLQLESVACKDWLTNKADRSVTGRVARQQCQGELQLPLSDLGAVALDYKGKAGMATSIGHAPQAAMIDPAAGSILAIAEALTNIVFAPLAYKLKGVSLSANWMWPCRNTGEDARLYNAVEAASDFSCKLGINIPTGKDSLSMTQTYKDKKVLAPGTVIISAGAEVSDVRKIVSPVVVNDLNTYIYYIDFSSDSLKLGGSALAQAFNTIGDEVPTVTDAVRFRQTFNGVQSAIEENLILAGHDISAGGIAVALLEMCFANKAGGVELKAEPFQENDLVKILFAENPGILVQVKNKAAFEDLMNKKGVSYFIAACPISNREMIICTKSGTKYHFDIDHMRDIWYRSSYRLDIHQSGLPCANLRYKNYGKQHLEYNFNKNFSGKLSSYTMQHQEKKAQAAIIRNKGTNGEREMAYALYLAGFDVKDVHLTDLASGRETLEDIHFIVFCGGFSDSDVLGSAKGWAAGILYNDNAKTAITNFYQRNDTLSLGVCNGCQLMAELGLLYPEHESKHKLLHNESHKFESSFVTLSIPENNSILMKSLAGTKLGVWVAHGEGRFSFPYDISRYNIAARYNHNEYPANPNGSPDGIAAVYSSNGRHLAIMPHPERAIFPWQCAYYPDERKQDEVTPWIELFTNAYHWVITQIHK